MVVAIIVVVAFYVASPFVMLWRLQRAAERDDTAALEELIDFPAVRASLKEQATNAWTGRLISGLIGGSGSEAVNQAIDQRVTPAAAAQLIKGARIEHAAFAGLNVFVFESGGLKASSRFNGFGWRVKSITLPGQN
jgi:hypothetical protein